MHVNCSAAPPSSHSNMAEGGFHVWAPVGSPSPGKVARPQSGRQYDDSANALSFGFLATAVFVSMFLIMAVFEKFLRPGTTPSDERHRGDIESQTRKRRSFPSPKMSMYDNGVSVLMPGDKVPSFIAHPAPIPSPLEHPFGPPHQQITPCHPISNLNLASNLSNSMQDQCE